MRSKSISSWKKLMRPVSKFAWALLRHAQRCKKVDQVLRPLSNLAAIPPPRGCMTGSQAAFLEVSYSSLVESPRGADETGVPPQQNVSGCIACHTGDISRLQDGAFNAVRSNVRRLTEVARPNAHISMSLHSITMLDTLAPPSRIMLAQRSYSSS